ncbi:hypothetical protein WJX72_010557 [[Myrmecia] bisecta]|uniref:UspA domain-containing protein n=1 Tax=[Myrmecia] bisecta TaxID=41462 RepID=A0AAW1Q879_9CHLO
MSDDARPTEHCWQGSGKRIVVLAVDVHEEETPPPLSERLMDPVHLVKEAAEEEEVRPRRKRSGTSVIGEAICEYAAYYNVYLVIMGNRIHRSLTESLQGSVIKYCVHHCKKPLLLLST